MLTPITTRDLQDAVAYIKNRKHEQPAIRRLGGKDGVLLVELDDYTKAALVVCASCNVSFPDAVKKVLLGDQRLAVHVEKKNAEAVADAIKKLCECLTASAITE